MPLPAIAAALTSAIAPTAAAIPARIAKAAQEFEGMALTQLLQPMFESVDSSKGPFGGGSGEAAWKPMMTAELAKHMTAHGGLGLARPVMQAMLRMQEAAQDAQQGAVPDTAPANMPGRAPVGIPAGGAASALDATPSIAPVPAGAGA